MKVFEILQVQTPTVSEEQLVSRLKNCDWNYEFAMDERRQRRGHEAMNVLEQQLYNFWKRNPDRATELWNEFSPFGNGNTPSFILRLEAKAGR